MANALSDFIGGFQAGNAITDQQRQQRQQSQLRQLAPQVVGGDPQAYAQAAAIDPQAAQQYQQGGDEIARRARGAAKFLQSALQSGNPQQIMAARQTIKPFMDTLKPGSSYPMDLDPQQEMAGIQGFLAQTSYLDPDLKAGTPTDVRSFQMMTAGLSPEDKEKARRVQLGLDGRASSAGFGFELVTGPDGKPRVQRRNPRTGAVEQYDENTGDFVPMGGPAGGSGTVFRASTGELIDVSKVTDPALRAEIMANPSAYGMLPDGASAQLPDRNVSPEMFVGRSKEQEAGAVTQAQEAAKLPYTAQEIGMRTQAAIQQAAGTEQAKGRVEQQLEAQQALPRVIQTSDQAISLIDQALQHPGRATATGLSGTLDPRNYTPGTDARDFQVLLDQIKGGTFLQAFQSLRGGGAITEVEGKKAEQAIARLSTAQSDEAFIKSLQDLKEVANAAKQNAIQRASQGAMQTAPAAAPVRRAVNPQTGQALVLRNGQWVPE